MEPGTPSFCSGECECRPRESSVELKDEDEEDDDPEEDPNYVQESSDSDEGYEYDSDYSSIGDVDSSVEEGIESKEDRQRTSWFQYLASTSTSLA